MRPTYAILLLASAAAISNDLRSEPMDTRVNPLISEPTAPFGALPFDTVRLEDFRPAIERGMDIEKREYAAILDNPEPPAFANTVEALELVGEDLHRALSVFDTLCSSATNDDLQALEAELAPVRARHWNELTLNPRLFQRVDALHHQRDALGLTPEQLRLLEESHKGLRLSGAGLDEAGRTRLAQINERLATLETSFAQNLQAEEDEWMLVIEDVADLEGLPESLVSAAASAAQERELAGKWVITLSRSSVEPFITYSARRDLRERAAKAWGLRGDNNDAHDNKAILREILVLRQETARLLGYPTYAHYATDGVMAGTPDNVLKLLNDVWAPAKAQHARERAQVEEMARADGIDQLEFWDQRYYANKVRLAHYDVNEEEVKQYFELGRMIDAMFYTANRLFGVTFEPIAGIPVYHPDVRVYEVKDADGRHLSLFYMDPFARTGKRSGAWMNSNRDQRRFHSEVRPLVSNNNNISKADPALLTLDDAITLFHEFGHGLHGMLTDVTYESLSGTDVDRDLVELPSQLFEHWVLQPEVLRKFALHYKTGEPIPEALIKRILAAQNYGEAFSQIEYVSSAIVDIELHLLPDPAALDVNAFEAEILAKYGMPPAMRLRHRPPHFHHMFDGDQYAAGYYTYLWAAVLEYDMFEAFTEAGDVFDPEVARRLKTYLYSAGNVRDPVETYKLLRGRMPTVEPLLRGKGFVE